MSAELLHRHYLHFSELPTSLRVMYTAVLALMGAGYLFAFIYLYHSHAGRDGDPSSLSYEDVVIAYSGSGKGSKLEAALRGPMAAMLPAEESKSLIAWVQQGAERSQYESDLKAVLENRGVSCHDGSNPIYRISPVSKALRKPPSRTPGPTSSRWSVCRTSTCSA